MTVIFGNAPAPVIDMDKLNKRLKKAHIRLMRNPETALYAGCMMMGTSEIVDDPSITAYTDGVNKRYGAQFINPLTDAEMCGLVLHENLHVALRHCIHGRAMHELDYECAAQAADYVVNGIIVNLKDKTLCALPKGGLVDAKYFDWSMLDIFKDLRKQQEGNGGNEEGEPCDNGNPGGDPGGPNPDDEENGNDSGEQEGPGKPSTKGGKGGKGKPQRQRGWDQHDFDGKDMSGLQQDVQKLHEAVDRALREGALLAGRLGGDIPRAITEALTPKVDWRKELMEFVSSMTKGTDEYSWRMFNRRHMAAGWFLPITQNETVGEVIVAIDTSGSIGAEQLNEFASELLGVCEAVQPDRVRVLWWDTRVAGEQLFEDKDYKGLVSMLKPAGGGGTRVGCVAEHIKKENLTADCVIVFTDGYVESDIKWDIEAPTLWMVTEHKGFVPPASGKLVVMED